MKLSAWTRLRLLATYLGFALAVVIIPIVSGAGEEEGRKAVPGI
jgi:hypothetical protein